MGKKIALVQRKTMDALERYNWPGDVGELRNVIQGAAVISGCEEVTLIAPALAALFARSSQ
jgi:DNA-binding NtrC family response regulator